MTEPEGTAWFLDAWAVRDGKVFASLRPPESIAAAATVFMSVPDLEAVPVGRISTALRATRSGFQEGLRTSDGEAAEIPFEGLDQVRELVRRAYLASGMGPESPGAVAGPMPRPETGPGGGAGTPDDVPPWLRTDPEGGAASPGEAFLARFRPSSFAPVYLGESTGHDVPPDLDDAVGLVARATILEWDRYLVDQDPEEIRGLVGWISVLDRAGVLSSTPGDRYDTPFPPALLDLAGEFHAEHLAKALKLLRQRWLPGAPFVDAEPISGYWSRGHLAGVPLPAAPGWHPRIRRLADMQLLPQVDRRFWTSVAPVRSLDIAPLILVHVVRQPPRRGRLPREPSLAEAAYRQARRSMTWFLDVHLPGAAEDVLAAFIDRCLHGPTTGTPGPGRGQPTPGRPGSGDVAVKWVQLGGYA